MNPDWKGIELSTEMLPEYSHYRMAEMEIAKAVHILAQFDSRTIKYDLIAGEIFDRIQLNRYLPEHREEWIDAARTRSFRDNTTQEKLIYFCYRNVPFRKIRELTSMSPNTIAKGKTTSIHIFPKYRRWDDGMLHQWNALRPFLNIWNEELTHMRK